MSVLPPAIEPGSAIRVLGIDLGTTNSTVSEVRTAPGHVDMPKAKTLNLDQATLLQGTYTHMLVPSFVAIKNGKTLVGEGAKRLRGQGLEQNRDIFYECKNDIGINKTYHKAPEGYRSAAHIGGKVIAFLHQGAMQEDSTAIDRVVVTVPASFQANQRQDTLAAAQVAGLKLSGGDLLDEPVAAFIDYLVSKGQELVAQLATAKNLVVFDFGGGTCDVAVMRLEQSKDASGLKAATLAVSRYHRLGGGDLDAAVVYDVLIPRLLEQNGLSGFDIGYVDKKKGIEPALLGVAEQLKIKLCDEIRKLQKFGTYDGADKSQVVTSLPGTYQCIVAGKTLKLLSPKLTAAQFEKTIEPFLDQDLLYARETEYRMTCSIFAPLQDALDRAGVKRKDVDLCLMVGGSSLIPQVQDALDGFFPNAQVLTYGDKDSMKLCISRGAAYHALALTLTGKGIVQPICHDDICIRTGSGAVTLIPKGVALPYPPEGGFAEYRGLGVPDRAGEDEDCPVRVEFLAGQDQRKLFGQIWNVPGPVEKGQPLKLEYRMDENQVLELRMSVVGEGGLAVFNPVIDKPLTSVVNPQNKRLKALEIEESLKTSGKSLNWMLDQMEELSELYAELSQREKAIETLKLVMQKKQQPDAEILNRIARYYAELGDHAKAEKFYKEAGAASSWTGPWFNLALAYKSQGKVKEAIWAVEKALAKDHEGPYLVLRAMLAEQEMNFAMREQLLKDAVVTFGSLFTLDDWELGWLRTCALMLKDEELREKAEQEIHSRQHAGKDDDDEVDGEPPILINPGGGKK